MIRTKSSNSAHEHFLVLVNISVMGGETVKAVMNSDISLETVAIFSFERFS